MKRTDIRLRYSGGGYGGFIAGVPARDLSADEARRYDEKRLLASGLYVLVEDKRAVGPSENKSEG